MSTKLPSFPHLEGNASRQAHCDLPEGTFERELGREGFFGPATQMYHSHPPTGWNSWAGPLRPRCFDLNKLTEEQVSYWDSPVILYNDATKMRQWRVTKPMDHLVRNGDGDEILFIHRGAGSLYCDYGQLNYSMGDYIIIPRSTMWRLEPTEATTILGIECTNGNFTFPDRGMVGRQAQFDLGMLDRPAINEAFRDQQSETEWHVHIKRQNAISTVIYPFNPLDAVGWQGDLSVLRINVKDIRPLMSHRYHLPPSAHSTFVGNRFVICTFLPRPFESDPGVLKVPYFHNNDDYDEVLFYHDGDFFSRDNIDTGMITWHPCGFTHGPHPKALEGMFTPKKNFIDETAVMLDTRDPLKMGDAAAQVEWTGYAESWKASELPVVAPKVVPAAK
ncbi:MAG: homogentisate 1,2-dioxygenase [Marinosulfonomonas sp.]|nr:homogentisate 1,2-dioxygenase [Marinosulfonomonas sp.]